MLDALKQLVLSFDCEDGLPSETYEATCSLLSSLDESYAFNFGLLINSTDGKYYLPGGCNHSLVLRQVFG